MTVRWVGVGMTELELVGVRKWLAYRLLTGDRRLSRQPGLGFRLRQLAAQFCCRAMWLAG